MTARKTRLKAVPVITDLPAKPPRKRAPSAAALRAQTVIQSQQILELMAQGWRQDEVAAKLGITQSRVSKLYGDELARMIEGNNEIRENIVAQALETLRQLKKANMRLALTGDDKAGRMVLGVVDREMELLGMKAEIKVQISNQRVDDTVTKVVQLIESSDGEAPRILESDLLITDGSADEDATG